MTLLMTDVYGPFVMMMTMKMPYLNHSPGGAIKLTATMAEREHTLKELVKMERVRNYLLSEGIVDKDSFNDYQNSL